MRLRKLRKEDAEAMLEWMHDASVVSALRTDFASKTIEDCLSFIAMSENDPQNVHLAIADENDEYMGTVSLKNISEKSAEFGITIRSCAMGKDFAIFGMKEIFKYGSERLGIENVYWCVDPVNTRALRFYDKNGFLRCPPPEKIAGYTAEEINRYYWYSYDCTASGGNCL